MGKVADFVGAGGERAGQSVAVLVRSAFANEFADVHPHLIAGLEGLVQLVLLSPMIIEEGEGRFGWLGTAVTDSDDGIVLGIILPLATGPMAGKLVGEGRLGAIAQGFIVAGGDGGDLARQSTRRQGDGGPLGSLREGFAVLKRGDVDAEARGGSVADCWLLGAVNHFEGRYRVDFPGGGAPVAGTVWSGVDRLRFVLGVEKKPATNADPAPLEMVTESASGPVFAVLLRDGAPARSHFHDDSASFRTV